MDPRTRGRRLDEALALCKRLWTEEKISHEGNFYQFEEIMFEPKPVQQPHPPVYIGGESDAALKRTALLGDGWYGVGHTPETVKPVLDKLAQTCESEGRNFSDLHLITCGEINSDKELQAWQETGLHQLVVTPWRKGGEAVSSLEKFSKDYLQ
jgi:alkanesulfonate monooxygenase SsuD/methylene tetrahydromethanopterin reductase-like flavin-dependent oxidoreductase (luciferase family)